MFYFMKRAINANAKSIDSNQPAQVAPADRSCRNFLLLENCLYVRGAFYRGINSILTQVMCMNSLLSEHMYFDLENFWYKALMNGIVIFYRSIIIILTCLSLLSLQVYHYYPYMSIIIILYFLHLEDLHVQEVIDFLILI